MTITPETVARYAKLANLSFSADEVDTMAHQLGTIINYVEKIAELDLSGVEATAQVLDTEPVIRQDLVSESFRPERALQNAPDSESGHFLVPKVIKKN